jgi:hypothetical protein
MLEDDEEKEIGAREKKKKTWLWRKCINTHSNVDCFILKIEKPLYDESDVMGAHAYVALSIKTNTFLLIKHLSSNNNFGTCYLEIKYPIVFGIHLLILKTWKNIQECNNDVCQISHICVLFMLINNYVNIRWCIKLVVTIFIIIYVSS